MAIQIGAKPSPTFRQPLELLSDCHRRVESFLRALIIVAEQAKGGVLDARQREALETALRYFREAAPKHTADEEESLFPRMRELGDDATREALEKIQSLEGDHRAAAGDHLLIEELGQKWLANNGLPPDETNRLAGSLQRVAAIYERHISIEDNEIFPLAAKVVPPEKLAEVGREMAKRRGQDPDRQWKFR
jgi:hemerythrin-like domain-containing protein